MKKGFKCTPEMIEQRRLINLGRKNSTKTLEAMSIAQKSRYEKLHESMIDKNGPIIDVNSIQAKIWPDISNTNCWIVTDEKYKKQGIHRFSLRIWEKINGKKPKGLCLCHKCDSINGPCCNPSHMFLGTRKDNQQDMVKKGRLKINFNAEKASKTKKSRENYKDIYKKVIATKRRLGIHIGFTTDSAKKGQKTAMKNRLKKISI